MANISKPLNQGFAAPSMVANYGPYASVPLAHAALVEDGLNVVGMTVGIEDNVNHTIKEYWYQGGTAQANLVEKQQGGGGVEQIQSDWEQSNDNAKDYIKNKPTIPAAQVNADWEAESGIAQILHKPTIPDTSNLATKQELNTGLAGKQDTINDLSTIRSGAASGATAYQKPQTGIPSSDMSSAVQTSLGKADTAQQPATTLAGYGITDGATKTELQELESEVDSKLEEQDAAITLLDGHDVVVVDDHTTVVSPDTQKIYIEPYYTEQIDGQGTAVLLIGNDYYSYLPIVLENDTTYVGLNNCVFINVQNSTIIGNTLTTTSPSGDEQYAVAKQVAGASDVADLSYTKTNDDVTPTKYTYWMCTDNTTTPVTWKKIATYDFPGIDDTPTAGSDYLVKSGGVAAELEPLQKGLEQFDSIVNKTLIQGDNLINLNSPGVIDGSYINIEGNISLNSNFRITDYIPVMPGKTYYSGNNGISSSAALRTFEFYDENKVVISGSFVNNLTSITDVTAPSGAAYFRASEDKRNVSKPQLNVDSLKPYSEYIEPYYAVHVKGSKLEDESVSLDKLTNKEAIEKSVGISTLFKDVFGDNLINTNASGIIDNSYMNSEGNIATNNNYYITDYIPVIPGKTYYAGRDGELSGSVLRTFEFYNENKVVIPGSFVDNHISPVETSCTAPANAAFFRTSIEKLQINHPQLNVDNLKPYSEYIEPYIALNGSHIEDNSIIENRLSPEVRQKLNSSKSSKVNAFIDSATLSNGSYLTLPLTHIKKNNFLVCDIVGSISSVSVGVGYWNSPDVYRGYASEWAEIDATNVKIYRAYGDAPSLVSTQAHGLTLTGKTKVAIDFGVENATIRIFNDLGDVYEGAMQVAGVGMPFVYNGGASNITCTLSDFPRDLSKKVWLFGDSYVTFEASDRWPYYLKQYGYTDYLCVAQPGLSPDTAVTELRNLLELGYTPSLLVWTLGMNGNTQESQSGGEYVINSYQKTNIDAVVQICEEYDIELVLGIVPTVPERQKTGFGNYVKSLGVRYIDFAKAVGTNSSGQWNSGLLSSDNVHPTALGAKVLASQVLADCPELTINN